MALLLLMGGAIMRVRRFVAILLAMTSLVPRM